jgi:hypothetical protein
MQQRERQLLGSERLQRQVQHDAGILAGREQQARLLEFGRDLAQDVDGLGLEPVQVGLIESANAHNQVVCDVAGWPHRPRVPRNGRIGLAIIAERYCLTIDYSDIYHSV